MRQGPSAALAGDFQGNAICATPPQRTCPPRSALGAGTPWTANWDDGATMDPLEVQRSAVSPPEAVVRMARGDGRWGTLRVPAPATVAHAAVLRRPRWRSRTLGAVLVVGLVLSMLSLGPAPEAGAADCRRGHIALTFDDGPSRHTPAVLDALRRRNVPATFFVVGQRVRSSPGIVRRQHREGHAVANHTYRHERLTSLSNSRIRSTVGATHRAIRDAGAPPVKAVRPPYGATNARVRSVLRDAGYAHVLWSVDPQDWRGYSPSTIARHVTARLAPGANILLHDGGSTTPNTVRALPQIIDTARARGYCFGLIDGRGRVVAPTPPAPPPPPPPPPPVQVAPPQEVSRLAGADRYATAVAVSQAGWPEGADAAVLATGRDFPDALAASVLAGAVEGPLLLSAEDRLLPAVAEELARLGVERVFVVGAVSESVDEAVRSMGVHTRGVRGRDRYETAARVAGQVAGSGTEGVYLVTGEGFADALAVGSVAAGQGWPILLTPPQGHPRLASWVDALGAEQVVVVGGTSAVSDAALEGLTDVEVERIAGPNRAATAVAVAQVARGRGYGADPLVASGTAFADGLAGGVLAARWQRPLLLTGGDRLAPQVHGWINDERSERVTVLGGKAVISEGVVCQLRTGYDRPDACD